LKLSSYNASEKSEITDLKLFEELVRDHADRQFVKSAFKRIKPILYMAIQESLEKDIKDI
jgi:hypothetical protein